MARLPRLFRTRSRVPKINAKVADIIVFGIHSDDFLFILIMVYCLYSLESPHQVNGNDYTQHSFMSKKTEKDIPIIPSDLAI